MRLEKYVAAPHFRLKDVFGRMIDLNDYQDKRLLIAFFRHAGCPFCNLRVHNLMKIQQKLKVKNLEMIFFFESKEQIILRSTFHREISPVPLIADPAKEMYRQYGLEDSAAKSTMSHVSSFVQTALKARMTGVPLHLMASGESFNTMPAEFLIERGLVIKHLHYSERLNDRLDMEAIQNFANEDCESPVPITTFKIST